MGSVSTQAGPQAPEPASEAKRPSFSALFATARPSERDYTRLLMALCGSMLVVAISICVSVLVDRVRLPDLAPPPLDPSDHIGRGAEENLKDVLAGQKRASSWDPGALGSVPQGRRPPRPVSSPVERPPPRSSRRVSEKTDTGPSPTTTAPEDGVDPAYATLWGSGDRYAASGRRASSEAARKDLGVDRGGKASSTGIVLPARLMDRVAGAPSGAPVIAALTRKSTLGGCVLPVGAEVHGTVAGVEGEQSRIFVDFDFARLRDGRTVPLRGVGRDAQGRHGVPAVKVLGRKAMGSVGLSSAGRVARQMGRYVAGRAGDVLGAGIEEATDSTTEKAQRVDLDEYVLVAAPGTPLAIYVLEAGT